MAFLYLFLQLCLQSNPSVSKFTFSSYVMSYVNIQRKYYISILSFQIIQANVSSPFHKPRVIFRYHDVYRFASLIVASAFTFKRQEGLSDDTLIYKSD